MNIWKVILVTLVIFSTGVITGGLVSRKACFPLAKEPETLATTNRPSKKFRPPQLYRKDFVSRAKKELSLTSDQINQIEMIVSNSQVRTHKLWKDFSPQMRAELAQTQEEIQTLLTPAQQLQFEELMMKKRRSRHEDGEKDKSGSNAPPDKPSPSETEFPDA